MPLLPPAIKAQFMLFFCLVAIVWPRSQPAGSESSNG